MKMVHILIVDNHIPLLETLQVALEGEYRVTTARSAAEALAAMGESMPDLVITDHLMPHLTGLEFIRLLRQRRHSPKVILFSSMLTNELVAQAGEAGAAACLPKPFDLGELKRIITELLGDKQ